MADQQPPHKRSRLTRFARASRLEEVDTDQTPRQSDDEADSATHSSGDQGDQSEPLSQTDCCRDTDQGAALQETTSQAAAVFANLAIDNKRRQGMYGAKAFGVTPLRPDSITPEDDISGSRQLPGRNQYAPLHVNPYAPSHVNPYAQRLDSSQIHAASHGPVNARAENPRTQDSSHNSTAQAPYSQAYQIPPHQQASNLADLATYQENLRQEKASAGIPQYLPSRLHPMTGGLRIPGCGGKPTRQAARLDDDRDHEGNLLPNRYQPYFNTGQPRVSTVPKHVHKRSRDTPDFMYRSAGQFESVMNNVNGKRKRAIDILPPQSFVYTRTNDPDFNVFHGFLLYPELCFLLANGMPIKDLISLYAISTDFHTIIDSRFTTVCLGQALAKAPESAKTFFYRTYRHYCRKDPLARIPHPNPLRSDPRLIPSFRWVQMVIYREKLVHEVIAVFAEYGCPLPARCGLALKRMWFLMDMPTNTMRIGAVHNTELITDLDLYFAMAFFVKLDMVCNDPVAPEKRDGVRKLLLSMPDGLTTLHRVLTRQRWRKKTEMLVAWVRHTLEIPTITNDPNGQTPEELGVPSVFGVPVREVGLLKYEYFGKKGKMRPTLAGAAPARFQYLLRPDQLVVREAIRRGLRFHKHILRCVLYGYINPATLENYPPRDWPRRIPEYNDEEYGINDAVGGIRAPSMEEGGDPILDVGDPYAGSPYTHVAEKPHHSAEQIKAADDTFLDLMEWWQADETPKQETDDLPVVEDLQT